MLLPTNSSAETIVRLQSINEDIQLQINVLSTQQNQNNETIDSLTPIATWEDFVESPEEAEQ